MGNAVGPVVLTLETPPILLRRRLRRLGIWRRGRQWDVLIDKVGRRILGEGLFIAREIFVGRRGGAGNEDACLGRKRNGRWLVASLARSVARLH